MRAITATLIATLAVTAPSLGCDASDSTAVDGGPADGSSHTDAAPGAVDAGTAVDGGQSDSDAGNTSADANPGTLPACPSFADPITSGFVLHWSVTEASGLAASHTNPGVLWTHNDSGDEARVYAISTTGEATASYALEGASASDWEDIAVGPGPASDVSYLYVGDIGGNGGSRSNVRIYRVAEPTVDAPSPLPPLESLGDVEEFRFAYPDGEHDAETLLVDPINGDVYIVVKAVSGASPVFRAAAPLSPSGTTELELVATLDFGTPPLDGDTTTTGGDISPSGDSIAVRTYDTAFLWRRSPGSSIAEALVTEPCPLPLADEGQGEALSFAADGNGYFTMGEGRFVGLHFYAPM